MEGIVNREDAIKSIKCCTGVDVNEIIGIEDVSDEDVIALANDLLDMKKLCDKQI